MSSLLDHITRRARDPDERVIDELARTEGDLVVLGAGGKMGVSLSQMAAAAFKRLGGSRSVHAVSRFSDGEARRELEGSEVRTIAADLSDEAALAGLPDAPNVVYMVGRKFGTSADASTTWALNAYLPGRVAQRYGGARISVFSSGNIYPLVSAASGGADETVAASPIGEYAQSCLARERILAHQAALTGSPLAIIRLNYAVDCRYGVLTDIARAVLAGRPVDVTMGLVNVVWQGDANRYALSALAHASGDPLVLNVTGPESASVRWLAGELGRRLDREPIFCGEEAATALLSNAGRCFGMFGYPSVTLHQMLDWTAAWLLDGGPLLDKPTHFGERAGRY